MPIPAAAAAPSSAVQILLTKAVISLWQRQTNVSWQLLSHSSPQTWAVVALLDSTHTMFLTWTTWEPFTQFLACQLTKVIKMLLAATVYWARGSLKNALFKISNSRIKFQPVEFKSIRLVPSTTAAWSLAPKVFKLTPPILPTTPHSYWGKIKLNSPLKHRLGRNSAKLVAFREVPLRPPSVTSNRRDPCSPLQWSSLRLLTLKSRYSIDASFKTTERHL